MHYYQHHIGDFDAATRHLTRVERSIYRDLIELYYSTEEPLSNDIAHLARKIAARGEDEKSALIAILDEYFHETPGGWFHDRCEEELDKFRKSQSQASAAGKASAAARAARRAAAMSGENQTTVQRSFNDRSTTVDHPFVTCSTDDQRTGNDASTNHKPITINQEPDKKQKPPAVADDELFPGVDPQVVADFKALRKQKRAAITMTAMQAIKRESENAGLSLEDALRVCCARGWQGFKAEWLEPKSQASGGRPSINSMGGGYGDDPEDPFSQLRRS